MLYKGLISDFKPDCLCVGCHVVHRGELLLLQKPADHPLYPAQWGAVAGKKNPGESVFGAIAREGLEEVGWKVDQFAYEYVASYAVIHERLRFLYNLFRLEIAGPLPKISLSSEHVDFALVSPRKALDYDLIPDEDLLINRHFGLSFRPPI